MSTSRFRHFFAETPRILALPATLFLVAASVTTVVRILVYFDGGIWLVAYLFLVGFLAQYLLGAGQAALVGGSDGRERLESLLWNTGSVLVPLSVMVGGKAGVLVGSMGLALALVVFGRAAVPAGDRSGRPAGNGMLLAYRVLILFMAVSVVTGIVLAWGRAWF